MQDVTYERMTMYKGTKSRSHFAKDNNQIHHIPIGFDSAISLYAGKLTCVHYLHRLPKSLMLTPAPSIWNVAGKYWGNGAFFQGCKINFIFFSRPNNILFVVYLFHLKDLHTICKNIIIKNWHCILQRCHSLTFMTFMTRIQSVLPYYCVIQYSAI